MKNEIILKIYQNNSLNDGEGINVSCPDLGILVTSLSLEAALMTAVHSMRTLQDSYEEIEPNFLSGIGVENKETLDLLSESIHKDA